MDAAILIMLAVSLLIGVGVQLVDLWIARQPPEPGDLLKAFGISAVLFLAGLTVWRVIFV